MTVDLLLYSENDSVDLAVLRGHLQGLGQVLQGRVQPSGFSICLGLCVVGFEAQRLNGEDLLGELDGLDKLSALSLAPAQVEQKVNAQLIEGGLRSGFQISRHRRRDSPQRVLVPVRGLADEVLLEQRVAVFEKFVEKEKPETRHKHI